MRQRTILCVVGARPNFMKIGPILKALRTAGFQAPLIHTGQHYDSRMNDQLFSDLGLPEPDINLEVGSGSHAQQTAEIMKRFEPVVDQFSPWAVLVVGDVNSTIACALVAAKKNIRVIHVEAGLRSYDRTMPEEINRVLTDQLSDFLFTTEKSALGNLIREGISPSCIHFVGNVMIDSLIDNLGRAISPAQTLGETIAPTGYALATLHRPANVDHQAILSGLLDCLANISIDRVVLFPLHPRTLGKIKEFGLDTYLNSDNLRVLPPVGYLEMLGLMRDAALVITDSGGVQEETTALGVPCLTVRENTERPITISEGTNLLVGTEPQAIMAAYAEFKATGGKAGRIPEYWDGKAAQRIASILTSL